MFTGDKTQNRIQKSGTQNLRGQSNENNLFKQIKSFTHANHQAKCRTGN